MYLHVNLHMYVCCPGMLKCIQTYCLPISIICNGRQGNADDENELYYSILVCPGLSKYRGENRCVISISERPYAME